MEGSSEKRLLTVSEIASLLQVPPSWIYSRTRLRGADQIPVVRIGKYCRFDPAAVIAWLKGESGDGNEAGA
jgi:predicted DNA-binding transcriptional regulator AlpA